MNTFEAIVLSIMIAYVAISAIIAHVEDTEIDIDDEF